MKTYAVPPVICHSTAWVALLCASVVASSAAEPLLSVTVTPQTQSAAAGYRASFRAIPAISDLPCCPSPTVTYQYQWLFKGKPIPGATYQILNVDTVLPPNAGTYTAHVVSNFGAATSAAAELEVIGAFPYTITTFAGSGSAETRDGIGRAAAFKDPISVVADFAGNLYVTERNVPVIRKITPEGVVTTFAGRIGANGAVDGQGSEARFNYPGILAIDSKGNLILADALNNLIRKITPDAIVTTIAGKSEFDQQGQPIVGHVDGVGQEARFNIPWRVAVDKADNIYVSDTFNQVIRKVTANGVVSTFAGTVGVIGNSDGGVGEGQFSQPNGVAVDSKGFVYVGDQKNFTIRKISPEGIVSTFAGEPGVAGSADGKGSAARFATPYGLAIDKNDNLYVGDGLNHVIRKITPDGTVVTIAGLANVTGRADGLGRIARFNDAGTITFDPAGNMFLTDSANNTIRKAALTAWFGRDASNNSVLNAPPGTYILEASGDLKNWEMVSSGLSDGNFPIVAPNTSVGQRFYRARTGMQLTPTGMLLTP